LEVGFFGGEELAERVDELLHGDGGDSEGEI
jgi:hypothetical protein